MLTDAQCRKAKTENGRLKLSDSNGLFLDVTSNGVKSWRLRYRLNKKDRTHTFGRYPDLPLIDAREQCADAKKGIRKGVAPGLIDNPDEPTAKDLAKSEFESIARDWYEFQEPKWSPAHAKRVLNRLEADIFPVIGKRQIAELTPIEVLAPLQQIENRGSVESAHKCRQHISMIFGFGISGELCTNDPTQHLKARMRSYKNSHFAAITDDKEALAQILRAMHNYSGARTVAAGLKLVPWLLVRPGELRQARWSDINLEGSEWRYTISKTGTEHIVPLPTQAVDVLKELHQFTGQSEYVFPNPRSNSKPMSENALQNGIKAVGFGEQQTAHGFRATARTMLDEVFKYRIDYIEHQLGHRVKDVNGNAYNRTKFLDERREMLQSWADWLESIRLKVPFDG